MLGSPHKDAGKLLADADMIDLLWRAINVDMNLKGPGKSVQTPAASLDVGFKTVMGEGHVKTEALELFTGGPTQVVTKMIAG